ncbi:Tryptase [Fragariocoptes setiger]|uniref:Tryptase n=1 Tax=Fragariocoptes setiger TaxID=1670756 RepID=A0ABQ7S7U7_9ACAR|nr:Tryptase [Fragariocoptes setiger]
MLQLQLIVLLLMLALFVDAGQSTAHSHRDWQPVSGVGERDYYRSLSAYGRRHNGYNSYNNRHSVKHNYAGARSTGSVESLPLNGSSRALELDKGSKGQMIERSRMIVGDFKAPADASENEGTAHINLLPSMASQDLFDGRLRSIGQEGSGRITENICGRAPKNKINDINRNTYVLDGKLALDGWFPWHVTVFCNDRFWCGGSIISPNRVMTTAHCIHPKNTATRCETIRVIAGTTEVALKPRKSIAQIRYAVSFIITDDYTANTENNDYVIMHLNAPFDLNQYIQPICLPRTMVPLNECYIQGSGDDGRVPLGKNYSLQYARMRYRDQCPWPNEQKHGINEPEMCFVPYESKSKPCRGDSGGALACLDDGSWYQVGITTFGEMQQCNRTNGEPWAGFTNTIFLSEKIRKLYDELTQHVIASWSTTTSRPKLRTSMTKHDNVQDWQRWPYANQNDKL